MSPRLILLISIAAAVAVPHAQDPNLEGAIQIDLRVADTRYVVSGRGTCLTQPHGTLHEVPAAQWNARHRDPQRYANLAFWRVQGVGDQFNLGIMVGPTLHRVSTVSVNGKGSRQGGGSVRMARSGAGGTFTIDATADTGARISGTITCSAFAAPVEDNG
jgi:hypothetical protein